MKHMNKKGFTLVELLVVIAIIALLSTLSVVALNSARQKSRDAKRKSDIRQIRTALEMYFDSKEATGNDYPDGTSVILGGDSAVCLGSNGFASTSSASICGDTIFMQNVPKDPLSSGDYKYTYKRLSSTSYTINYKVEGESGTAANKQATPDKLE